MEKDSKKRKKDPISQMMAEEEYTSADVNRCSNTHLSLHSSIVTASRISQQDKGIYWEN